MNRLGLLVLVLGCAANAATGDAPALDLAKLPEPNEVARLVWEHAPDLAQARAKVGLAEADVWRSELLPNPTFDFGWSGLTVGETNPAGLTLGQTPSYTFTLSETFELGKRGPRQTAARLGRRAVSFEGWEALRQRFLDVEGRIAEVASAEVRIAALADAADDAARLTVLQQARASKGDTSGLDADRARLEEQKILSNLGEARENLQNALIECSHAAGLNCLPFGAPERAQAFLEKARELDPPHDLGARPDLKSLEAQAQAAQAQVTLAERRALPDPTVRLGYVRDQLVIAGDQPNALFVGVSVPLPIFDHGQADAQAARVQAELAETTRTLLTRQAQNDVVRLRKQLEQAKKRQQTLTTQTLPLARQVVESLGKTVLVGGAPIQDLLLARRTLQELVVDSADVDLLVARLTLELDRVTGRGAAVPAPLEPYVKTPSSP